VPQTDTFVLLRPEADDIVVVEPASP